MIKLNDNNIMVGQIKQILKDFNLPNCPVVSSTYTGNSPVYIKNRSLYRTSNNQFIQPYLYNDKLSNLTTNLRIDNNLYDIYTHRYLGHYLRFLKDYDGMDLMSMYNCCDYESVNTTFSYSKTFLNFNSSEAFICYAVPIMHTGYTLKVDTRLPIELCVSSIEESDNQRDKVAAETHAFISASHRYYLNVPELAPKKLISALHNYEKNLTLFIKIPASYQGSLVILEGDYTQEYATNNSGKQIEAFIYKDNPGNKNLKMSGFSIQPQLLCFYNNDKYLLADRLIQYLTGNVITPNSEPYDIKKLQDFMFDAHVGKTYGGVWHPDNLALLRKFIIDNKFTSKAANLLNAPDILGYGDSDVEASLEILYPVEGGLDERYI